jgi:hypothetical protein
MTITKIVDVDIELNDRDIKELLEASILKDN